MGRSLDNPINWSFGVGRLFDIAVRIHIFFVLGALYIIAMAFKENPEISGVLGIVLTIALLFACVLCHEFGHCFGSRATGGAADEILIWPLGGLAMCAPPHVPRAHLITALAGPAVNFAFCLLAALILIVLTGSALAVPWNPFRPFTPVSGAYFGDWSAERWLGIFFSLNFMLLLFNLAPVFPLDGGRVLQAFLWPARGFHQSMMLASGIGMIGAIGFVVIGIFSGAMMLFFIAVFGYFTCWQQRQQLKMGVMETGGEFGYDFSQGYTSLERSAGEEESRPSFFARRRARKEAARRAREAARLEDERRQVDAILAKISRDGIESLTPKERKLLQRETQRQASEDSNNG
jgi:Zn-dependent protease